MIKNKYVIQFETVSKLNAITTTAKTARKGAAKTKTAVAKNGNKMPAKPKAVKNEDEAEDEGDEEYEVKDIIDQ